MATPGNPSCWLVMFHIVRRFSVEFWSLCVGASVLIGAATHHLAHYLLTLHSVLARDGRMKRCTLISASFDDRICAFTALLSSSRLDSRGQAHVVGDSLWTAHSRAAHVCLEGMWYGP